MRVDERDDQQKRLVAFALQKLDRRVHRALIDIACQFALGDVLFSTSKPAIPSLG